MKLQSPNTPITICIFRRGAPDLGPFCESARVRIPLKKSPEIENLQVTKFTHTIINPWQRKTDNGHKKQKDSPHSLFHSTPHNPKSNPTFYPQEHQEIATSNHANLCRRTIHEPPPSKWWSPSYVVASDLLFAKRWNVGASTLCYSDSILWYGRLWWKRQCPKRPYDIQTKLGTRSANTRPSHLHHSDNHNHNIICAK